MGEYKPPEWVRDKPRQELLKERLGESGGQEEAQGSREERLKEALEAKLARSMTRKTLDGFFFLAIMVVFIDGALRMVNQHGVLSTIWWLPWIFTLPVGMVWKPEPNFVQVGPVQIYLVHVVSLVVYGVLYVVLRAAHRKVCAARLYIPQ